jgi:hypothetical protein
MITRPLRDEVLAALIALLNIGVLYVLILLLEPR